MKIELSPEARALVEAGREEDGPSAEQRARCEQRLSATLGVASLAGTTFAAKGAAAATQSSQAGLWGKAMGLLSQVSAGAKVGAAVAVVGAGVSLGVVHWSQAPAPSPPREGQSPRATQVAPAGVQPEAATVRKVRESGGEGVRAGDTEATASGNEKQADPRALRRLARERPAPLQRELALLGAAQQRLREGDAEGALELLERHARRFPGGALRQERNSARAIALCTLGRNGEGRRLARELARRAPKSPLAARVAAACGTAAPTSP